jgi:hypothetical protein
MMRARCVADPIEGRQIHGSPENILWLFGTPTFLEPVSRATRMNQHHGEQAPAQKLDSTFCQERPRDRAIPGLDGVSNRAGRETPPAHRAPSEKNR